MYRLTQAVRALPPPGWRNNPTLPALHSQVMVQAKFQW